MDNKQLITPHCPLCNGTNFQLTQLGLQTCDQCGLIVSNSIWQAQSNETLEEEYFGEDYQPQTSFWVTLFERWNNRHTLKRLASQQYPGKRLLEIGIGSGSFLQAARTQGFEVTGCDLSKAICERVTHTYGIPLHCKPISAIEGNGCFDVIVMNHVLEHVNEPISFLHDVLRLLSPNGIAHIAVPNVACWEAKLSGWTSYEPYHLTYFTPNTLQKTIIASGLTVEHANTHESFSGWFLALLRTAMGVNRHGQAIQPNKNTGRQNVSGLSRTSLVEHTYRLGMVCAGGGIWPLRWVQAKLGFGDEAICIARKPNSGDK
jgi:2-polyprenyl-3-methyl-5-hydroxy-6-metoxy-1,4-benzoquinol methylase